MNIFFVILVIVILLIIWYNNKYENFAVDDYNSSTNPYLWLFFMLLCFNIMSLMYSGYKKYNSGYFNNLQMPQFAMPQFPINQLQMPRLV